LYTYYFAGRQYAARNKLQSLVGAGNCFKSNKLLVDIAQMNAEREIDSIYAISEWKQRLEADLSKHFGFTQDDTDYSINRGKTDSSNHWHCELVRRIGIRFHLRIVSFHSLALVHLFFECFFNLL